MDVVMYYSEHDGFSTWLIRGIPLESILRLSELWINHNYGVMCYADSVEGWCDNDRDYTPTTFADYLIKDAESDETLHDDEADEDLRDNFMHQVMCKHAKVKRDIAAFMRSVTTGGALGD